MAVVIGPPRLRWPSWTPSTNQVWVMELPEVRVRQVHSTGGGRGDRRRARAGEPGAGPRRRPTLTVVRTALVEDLVVGRPDEGVDVSAGADRADTTRRHVGARLHRRRLRGGRDLADHIAVAAVGGGEVERLVRAVLHGADPVILGQSGDVGLADLIAGRVQEEHPDALSGQHPGDHGTLPVAPGRAVQERDATGGDGRVARTPLRLRRSRELGQIGHRGGLVIPRVAVRVPAVVGAPEIEIELVVAVSAVLGGPHLVGARRGRPGPGRCDGRDSTHTGRCRRRRSTDCRLGSNRPSWTRSTFPPRDWRSCGFVPRAASPVPM